MCKSLVPCNCLLSEVIFVVTLQQPVSYNTKMNVTNYREGGKQPGVFKIGLKISLRGTRLSRVTR